MKEIIDMEKQLIVQRDNLSAEMLSEAKKNGFSDRYIGKLIDKTEEEVYQLRKSLGISPDFKLVDTCAAEFQAHTPYYYSTFDTDR